MKFLIFLALIGALYVYGKRALGSPATPRAEAAKLLGIASDASPADVIEAHRRLIERVHPDAGGTPELAARINAARDTLLAR